MHIESSTCATVSCSRIVVNAEKEQIKRVKPGETIVTEIEKLARIYPYDEPISLKVKSVVNFVTQTIGFRQLERLEKGILEILKGTMDEMMFFDLCGGDPWITALV